jgi:DNA (cytosine-5)-methyltransferase 1
LAYSNDKGLRARFGRSNYDYEKKGRVWSFDRGRSESDDEWSDFASTENEDLDVANTNGKRGRLWETGSKDAKDVGQSPRGQETLGWWDVEPDVGRVAHGVPQRVDRLKGLGNAVVPQIPFLLGLTIREMIENE